MKNLLYILIPLALFSCNKKELKVPVLAVKGIQELQDHSQIWMFFEIKDNDTIANINRKNTISTTHWIYNIDRKLPLKAIIPSISKFQFKHANGIHSKEGRFDYFSYADTISDKLSFIKFDGVVFKQDSVLSKTYINENSDSYLNYNNISLTFNPKNTWINDAKMEDGELTTTLLEFIDFSSEGAKTMLHLNFNQDLLYQDYLYYLTLIKSISNPGILINNLEFIFDPAKVPDCGCD